MFTRRETLSTIMKAGAGVYGLHFLSACGSTESASGPTIPWPELETPPVLGGDPSLPWWARDNYAPVSDEIEAFDLEVHGSIPPELDGFFLRNGPNSNSTVPDFWFFGDGMLHSVELSNGRALSYRNKWIQTDAFASGRSTLFSNYGNTALLHHGDRLLALYEQGAPFEIELPSLNTIGRYDFKADFNQSMTAHPKVDPITGDIHFFGYAPFPPYLRYYVASAQGEMLRNVEVALPQGVMMHDFQLTENHVVFFDLPVVFRSTPGATFPIAYDPSAGARIGLMPRTGENVEVQWFEIDPCYMFHTINAFEQGNEVVIEGCRLNGFVIEGPSPDLPAGTAWRWTLNLDTDSVTESALFETKTDFPIIDSRLQGRRNRMTYALSLVEPSADYPLHPDGIIRFDNQTGSLDRWASGYGAQPDEAIFVPAPDGTAEDEGWLLSMVYNRVDKLSELVILEAQQLSKGPIAKIVMPRRIPFGFHGTWASRN